MIEGKSLAKTAALCGIHPTTAFRWRHRFLRAPASDKPRGLKKKKSSKRTKPSFSNLFKGRRSDLPRKARRRGGIGQASWPSPGQHSHPRRPRPERRDLRRDLGAGSIARFGEPRPRRNRHAGQSSHRRWRQGDSPLCAHRAGIAFHTVPSPGKPSPSAPHLHINNVNAYHQPPSSNGSTASTASPPRTCPIISVGSALSKPWATNSNRQAGSKALSEKGHTNR